MVRENIPSCNIVLSSDLFSSFARSVALRLQSFHLLVGLCLLSTQLHLGHVEVLACTQLLELLVSIIQLMLQRLDEELVSPGLIHKSPS